MRAIIVGAGNAGGNLAARLCSEKYDVVVIDSNPAPLALLEADLDILTLVGNGSSPAILKKAGIEDAELLVAVTSTDEVNILACVCARTAGVRHRVARISSPEYLDGYGVLHLKDLGIDLAINPREECAQELANLLKLPGTQEVIDLLEGRVLAAGFKVSADSPLLRYTLSNCPNAELLKTVRFVALHRGGDEVQIPFGDTRFMVGDDLYVVGEPDKLPPFLDVVYPDRPVIDKVIIAGGGALGLSLARLLEKSKLDIVLIEQNSAAAEHCSSVLNRALVLRGDVMSEETLENAGITEHTAFVAAMDRDENNIISCLLAQKAGVSLTVGKVSKPEYVPIINSLSLLDRAVSPHLSMMNAILHFVRGKNVQSASLLHTLPGELLEIVIKPGHPWSGTTIRELQIPRGVIIATMERHDATLVPTGELRLIAGDRLVVFALPGAIRKLEAIFNE